MAAWPAAIWFLQWTDLTQKQNVWTQIRLFSLKKKAKTQRTLKKGQIIFALVLAQYAQPIFFF